ncbi:hypothetical protein KAI87_08140, partial [Myxococcota bacterium]|nr:hypothetical protein [Myxococcota bacterium]
IYRILPRENDDVNQEWLCDEGRMTYKPLNEERLSEAYLDSDEPVKIDEALSKAKALLAPVAEAKSGAAIALSMHATLEEAYIIGRFAKEVLATETIALLGYGDWEADKLLRVADHNPNRIGISRIFADMGLKTIDGSALSAKIKDKSVKALVVVGSEFDGLDALAKDAAALEILVHLSWAKTALFDAADVVLPSLPWSQIDGTWVNFQNRAQRLAPAFNAAGSARPAHAFLLELSAAMGVSFTLPSTQSIRSEMQRELSSFKNSNLTDVGPLGHVLDWS